MLSILKVMKEIAILGPTASGKSALAVKVAQEVGANILSLDSLSVYKEADIVSAKPTLHERAGIPHYGIDALFIDEYFSVTLFFDLYEKAKEASLAEGKHLIIVGGTGFYLKSMIDGLSSKLPLSKQTKAKVTQVMQNTHEAFKQLASLDPQYAAKISDADRYRIEKWYEIYIESGEIATNYFSNHQKNSIINTIEIFEIATEREVLRERIDLRTTQMIETGVIDEVFGLEKKYGRAPNPMGAIGIKETLQYLDGHITKTKLHELICIHTAQLAKRQETFNKSQFPNRIYDLKDDLYKKIIYNF